MVLRTATISLVWSISLVIGFALNWLIDQILGAMGAGESIKAVSRQIVLASIVIMSAVATWNSLWDMFKFSWALTKSPMPESSENGERLPRD